MQRVSMSEPTARFTFCASCGTAIFATILSMVLGAQQSRLGAAVFLTLALAGCVVCMVAYRRYTELRKVRWTSELKPFEDELNQALNHSRMNIIIEHVTGPLNARMLDPDEATPVDSAKTDSNEETTASKT